MLAVVVAPSGWYEIPSLSGEAGNAAGASNRCDRVFGAIIAAWDETGASGGKIAIECLTDGLNEAKFDQGTGDMRAADRAWPGQSSNVFQIYRNPNLIESSN